VAPEPAGLFASFLVFALFTAIFLGWLLIKMGTERLTFGEVLCPLRGRTAEVIFLRTADGTRLDVVRCSLLGTGAPTTWRQCMKARSA
jgi:hypothetical protein